MINKTKITVVGCGYVGMSIAVLLAQYNDVVVLDVDRARVDRVNNKRSTVADLEIEAFLEQRELSLTATLDKKVAYEGTNYVVVATPTNYDLNTKQFDTRSVDGVVANALELTSDALIIIKSTIPVGHTKSLQEKFLTDRVIFSPEFLREGQALHDNLYPSRIILGSQLESGKAFVNLLVDGSKKKNIETLFIGSTEAEAIKLFSNTYLAMRISFFNELDSYALANNLDTKSIINGVCLDERIGGGYNNPSFGYGGYCLPKDTKQLLAHYNQVPQVLIQAIVSSNATRKEFIGDYIVGLKPKVVGIFRLVMKQGSDNFRESAVQDIIKRIRSNNIKVVIYEPLYNEAKFLDSKVVNSLDEFKNLSDYIISNRMNPMLDDVAERVITRDLFGTV